MCVVLLLLGGCFESVPSSFGDDDDDVGSSAAASTTADSTPSPSGTSGEDESSSGWSFGSSSTSWVPATTTSGGSSDSGAEGSTMAVDPEGTSSSSSSSSSTGNPVVEACGDGQLDEGEHCDDGPANGVQTGDCAPDCSAFIHERVIVVSEVDYDSAFAFGSDAVIPILDAGCEAEFGAGARALFAYGDERRASVGANAGDGAIDWVLDPWTRYLNDQGQLVWLTESVALLGVDGNGTPHDFEHALWVYPENNPVITGLNTDWTTQDDADCGGWVSIAPTPMASGNPWFVDGGRSLRLPGLTSCGNDRSIYCVLP